MKKLCCAVTVFVLLATACIGGGRSVTTILVDYSHDEFPSFVAMNFPAQVVVHPGTELVFQQTWTGEPHSVTGGTLVDELMAEVSPYMEKAKRGEPIPDEPPKDVVKLQKRVAYSIDHESEEFDFVQTGAQPCYLSSGEPRKDGKPCEEQEQPVFTGKQSFYNSGLIPYEGPQGNEFAVQLADDVDPGSYWFFCNFHGEFQSTEVVVKSDGEKAQTPEQVNRAARNEVKEIIDPFKKIVDDARDGSIAWKTPDMDERMMIRGRFAGLFNPAFDHWHSINAFVPKRFTARAGEDITWNLIGFHTISFGVPDYFPVMTFEGDGTVIRNKKLDPPAGGARKVDLSEEELYEGTEPVPWDGGTYDGTGFWSSGTIDASPYLEYTMRITEPGTYRYACLIHPPMVGTVEVT